MRRIEARINSELFSGDKKRLTRALEKHNVDVSRWAEELLRTGVNFGKPTNKRLNICLLTSDELMVSRDKFGYKSVSESVLKQGYKFCPRWTGPYLASAIKPDSLGEDAYVLVLSEPIATPQKPKWLQDPNAVKGGYKNNEIFLVGRDFGQIRLHATWTWGLWNPEDSGDFLVACLAPGKESDKTTADR